MQLTSSVRRWLFPLSDRNAFFDEAYYIANNPDVASTDIVPFKHFERHGCWEGRSPSADFDMLWFYASEMQDRLQESPISRARKLGLLQPGSIVRAPDDDAWMASDKVRSLPPYLRMLIEDIGVLKSSGIFDISFIKSQLPAGVNDVAQYFIRHSPQVKLNPCLFFDTQWYEERYRDASGGCAAIHYIRYGADEDRDPGPKFSTGFYRSTARLSRGVNPLAHYLASGGSMPIVLEGETNAPLTSTPLVPSIQYADNGLEEAFSYALNVEGLCNAEGVSRRGDLAAQILNLSLKDRGVSALDRQVSDAIKALTFLAVSPRRALHSYNHYRPDHILGRYHDRRLAVGARFSPNAVGANSIFGDVKISILMPTYKSPAIFLQRAILSVLNQTYANWQLCIFDDASPSDDVRAVLRYYASLDNRIKIIFGSQNSGISAASNGALEGCDGDFVGLLDHDDMLTSDALEAVAEAVASESADIYYSDECKIDDNDVIHDFFSKPDWSPLLMLNYMYMGHFTVYRRELIKKLKFRSLYDFSQDYDLALRATGLDAVKVSHIERCIYGWRMISGSAAQGDKPEARISNIAALQSDIDRRGWNAIATPEPFANAVRFKQAHNKKVSIIVPSDNVDNICNTVDSVRNHTSYGNYEILVVTRSDVADAARQRLACKQISNSLRFVDYNKIYNFSDKCNVGAKNASGDFLIFFNDDVRVVDASWLTNMLDFLVLDGIGAVGPKLLYEDGSVQHGGMVTGVRRFVGTAFHTFKADSPDYFGFLQLVREVSLLCGACLAVKADLFEQIGGFDAVNTPIMHSDVDLCLRIWEAGSRCVYTPYACLTHIGHLSIGAAPKPKKPRKDKADIFILKRFPQAISRDPYFTKSMRDMLYIDSQEPFDIFPGKRRNYEYENNGRDIIIFSHDLSASGAPKIVFDMAFVLRQRGDYVVVVSQEDGPFRQRLVDVGVDVVIDTLLLDAHPYMIEFARNFDVAIGNTILTWRLASALSAYTKFVLYAHETGLADHLASAFPDFPASLAQANTILAGSELSVKALATHGVTAQCLEYGVDEPVSNKSAHRIVDSGSPRLIKICLIGTIEPRKGQDLGVLGFKLLPENIRKDFRLTVIGRVNDEPFFEAIRAIAADTPEIVFEAPVTLEEYHRRLDDCDIVLCPSRDDTLPIVSLDALASRKTLIVSTTTGTSAYIDHGVSGLLLRVNSPEDVAQAIISASDAGRRKSIGNAARNVYQRKFSRGSFEHRFVSVIDEGLPKWH